LYESLGVTLGDGRVFTPAHPFGNQAATNPLRSKAHGFASPPFGGFALSRMKGVFDPSAMRKLAPGVAIKLATPFAS
jgi:hypothetical protein